MLRHVGFSLVVACELCLSSCGAQAPEHVGSVFCDRWALSLRHGSSVNEARGLAPRLWDLSSPTRDRTHVPCIGRRILNHWTTREVPLIRLLRAMLYARRKWSDMFKDILAKKMGAKDFISSKIDFHI